MRCAFAVVLAMTLAACAGVERAASQPRYNSLLPGTIGVAVENRGADIVVIAVGTAAARAGVREGDRVVRCNGESVESARVFERQVLDSRPGSVMRLEIRRGDETRILDLPVEEMLMATLV